MKKLLYTLYSFIAAALIAGSTVIGGCTANDGASQDSIFSDSENSSFSESISADDLQTTPGSSDTSDVPDSSSDSSDVSSSSKETDKTTASSSSATTSTSATTVSSGTTTPPPVTTTSVTTTTTKATTTTTKATTTTTKATTTTTKATTTTTKKVTTTTAKPAPVKPSPSYIITPTADGKTVYKNSDATIDASNSSKGYIMIKTNFSDSNTYKIVLEVKNVGVKYTFQLNNKGKYEVIPLTEGSGTYTVYVLKQVSAGKGSVLFKQDINASISDSFLPFLTPNQYCMYDANSECVALASELCGGKDELGKVEAVYDYVINNIDYVSTAENGANGYVPYPDRTLSDKYGICFDYSSLLAAMLRSQKIPTKVVVGYTGSIYHSWLSVYVEGSGWIDGIISFDGYKWNRMDPTFASSGKQDGNYQQIIDYIKNNSNYSDMYYY